MLGNQQNIDPLGSNGSTIDPFWIKRFVEQQNSCNAGGTADFGALLETATRFAQTGSSTLGCSWGDPECAWVLCAAPGSSGGLICHQNCDPICLSHSVRKVRRPSAFQSKYFGEVSSLLPPSALGPVPPIARIRVLFWRGRRLPNRYGCGCVTALYFGSGASSPNLLSLSAPLFVGLEF